MSMDDYEQLKAEHNDFALPADRLCLEENLTAFALFGLQDPLRDNIVESVQSCKDAGITVIMCTGDYIETAIAISKEAGIVTQKDIDESEDSKKWSCMTGKDFREYVGGLKQKSVATEVEVANKSGEFEKVETKKLEYAVGDMKKFKEIKPYLKVLARCSPDDKMLLVTGIQASGGVVAVTGDGSNDAPALTKADVGFAMGITGTDIAKGACDIILLTDDFSCILVALKYGRNVYDNVRKFIQF